MLEILHGIVRHTLQIANSVEAFPSNFDPRKLCSSFLVNIQLKPKLTDNPKEFPREKKRSSKRIYHLDIVLFQTQSSF